jgi:hypothetical protein
MKTTMKKIRYTSKTVVTLSLAAALGIPAGAQADATATQAEIARTVGFVPDFMKAMPANLVPGLTTPSQAWRRSRRCGRS